MDDSVAAMLLGAAREDAKAMRALAALPDLADAIVGFHAQQAIEKSLKAVLSKRRIPFRRTHDLAELLDVLADHDVEPPPFAERVDEFNPFAVEARYGLIGAGALDRIEAEEVVAAVLAWAELALRQAPG